MSNTVANPIRIMLVDDHKLIREGLREFIQTRQDMLVVGDVGTRAEAIEMAKREQPDVVVLDLDLGAESGLDVLPELLKVARTTSVIILTGMRDPEKRDRAMELGAKGMVLKENGVMELLNAIEKVYRTGEYWFEPGAMKRLLDRRRSQQEEGAGSMDADPEGFKIRSLTPTERELITYIGEGFDNRQIAERMHIAESTVRNNLTRVYDKLDIQGGRLGLLVYAYRHGLVKPAP